MPDERQQVRRERTRRSRRTDNAPQNGAENDGQTFADAQTRLDEIDDIINDIVTPPSSKDTVALGDDTAHDVTEISNEERVRNFRQQGGE